MPSNVVKKIGLDFQIKGVHSKEELKKILCYTAEVLKKQVNNSLFIRKHLSNFPFEIKNIQVTIFINSEDNRDLFHPNICTASIHSGKFNFRTDDPEKKYTFKTDVEEEYVNYFEEFN